MTPQEQNELLREANKNADKAINRTKRVISLVENMEIVNEETVHSYFRNKPSCVSVEEKISGE